MWLPLAKEQSAVIFLIIIYNLALSFLVSAVSTSLNGNN